MDLQSLCQQSAQILNGTANMQNGVCSISVRRNLNVRIQGCPSHEAVHAGVTFESLDYSGNALNLGEVVVLDSELTPFVNILVKNGLIVSAIHNHWIFTNPNILYVHFQSVESPLSFARKTAEAFTVLSH
ncbi:DUF1259 domain-containing protein [Viridibacillus arvi]|uniref:DUF1259 domain-containing protein n=1 Tax=Viridibacillus arvi TaxID=263475 RepID=UPI0036A52240